MTYCRFCGRYTTVCAHHPAPPATKPSPWGVWIAYAFILGVLTYAAGGVWGLW